MQQRLASSYDTAKFWQSSHACLVNLPCISASAAGTDTSHREKRSSARPPTATLRLTDADVFDIDRDRAEPQNVGLAWVEMAQTSAGAVNDSIIDIVKR